MSIFNLYYRTADGETLKCARVQLQENARKQLETVYFQYHSEFLDSEQYPIDPKHLPKTSDLITFHCDKDAPGFIDDVLPDDWGKKVLARVYHLDHKPSVSELLGLMRFATTGALYFGPEARLESPTFDSGCDRQRIHELHDIANKIDLGLATIEEIEQIKLNMFSRGSSVGGARPKVMVHDDHNAYIAKFPKQGDLFDYATVEHACLELMRLAGLNVAESLVEKEKVEKEPVEKGHTGKEPTGKASNILFVKRFDVIDESKGRYHQITANALLKSTQDQTDPLTGKYDQISQLISRYSVQPEKDNAQLFAQMLFNKALNNTDDHLRNFSFTCKENGWQLSPAYDVVPSLTFGKYHQLTVGYQDFLPDMSEAVRVHKNFQLTKSKAEEVVQRVAETLQQWEAHFAKCGVSDADILKLKRVIKAD